MGQPGLPGPDGQPGIDGVDGAKGPQGDDASEGEFDSRQGVNESRKVVKDVRTHRSTHCIIQLMAAETAVPILCNF